MIKRKIVNAVSITMTIKHGEKLSIGVSATGGQTANWENLPIDGTECEIDGMDGNKKKRKYVFDKEASTMTVTQGGFKAGSVETRVWSLAEGKLTMKISN